MKNKKFLSLLMALMMIFSATSLAVNASDVLSADEYAVTLVASDVVRVAEAVGSMAKGSVIVKATPSGLPEISSNYTIEVYAGETPVYAQITFTANIDVTDVSITCTNNDTVNLELSNPEDNTYVWSVTGGTAEAGSYLDFEVTYNYNGAEYVAYTSIYVENIIQPAGFFIRTYRLSPLESNHSVFIYRILGKNTYGSFYQSGTDLGDEYENDAIIFSHGYYNFVDFEEKDWGCTAEDSDGYGLVLWGIEDYSSKRYANMTLDRQRPVSTTYIDASEGTALNGNNVNLRYTAMDLLFGEPANKYIRKLTDETMVLPGQSEWSADSVNDDNASAQLGFDAMGKEVVLTDIDNNNYAEDSDYNLSSFSCSVPFNGTSYVDSMQVLNDGTKETYYTLITDLYSYRDYGGATSYNYSATNIHLIMYDKGDLKEQIADTQSLHAPSVTTTFSTGSVEDMVGYKQLINALNDAQHIAAKPNLSQAEIDSAYEELVDATEKLGKNFWIEAEVIKTTDTDCTVKVTALGDVTTIRFINSANETFTFNPDNQMVNSVTELGNGIVEWNVTMSIYKPEENYKVYAKLNGLGWNPGFATVTVSERVPDTSLKLVDIKDDLDGVIYRGVNEMTVQTGLDVIKVQLLEDGNTWTFTENNASYFDENGIRTWTINMNFSKLGDHKFYIRTRSPKTSFEVKSSIDVTVFSK